MTDITAEDIEQLLTLFSKKGQYDASRTGEQNYEIHRKCEELFEKDYICCVIDNDKGSLSPNYPSQIIVPVEEKSFMPKDVDFLNGSPSSGFFDALKFKEIASKSNVARCRLRFPAPVILCKGKFVCRSATLACGGEMLFRDMSGIFNSVASESDVYSRNSAYFTDMRSQDIKLLKELSVNYICDLMVENKKVKYGLKVSSSEKIDKENRYCEFKIVQLPYPGCEFFKKFKDSNYVAEGLKFDWEQNYVDSSLTLPSDSVASTLGIHWSNYKLWDLVKLTQNYLKLLVTYIVEGKTIYGFFNRLSPKQRDRTVEILCRENPVHFEHCGQLKVRYRLLKAAQWTIDDGSGPISKERCLVFLNHGTSSILIHCISGWDRTPLFISLLRMTLWADGRIHSSLSAIEMAYLTLAYDWYLFGHDLPSRLKVGEEILFFCFEFLKFISSDEFSSKKRSRKISTNCTDTPLDILIEEESPEKSISSSISSAFSKPENASTSIFYASLDNQQDIYSSAMFYSCIDSLEEGDIIKSSKLHSQSDVSSDSDYPPTLVNSVESLSNNNGLSSSSSPVPVPNTRQRFDSLSSLGSWQYVSGTGSLLGSVTSRSSSAEINSNSSNSSSHQENGNIGGSPLTTSGSNERAEKLIKVRTIMHRAYRKVIENKDSTNGSYFPWRR